MQNFPRCRRGPSKKKPKALCCHKLLFNMSAPTGSKFVPIKEQKRSIKPNAGFPSKRVKITPPQEQNLKNRSLSSTFQGLSSNENIPLSSKRAQNRASLDGSSRKMEVEPNKVKKTFSFESKPYSNDVHQSQFQIEVWIFLFYICFLYFSSINNFRRDFSRKLVKESSGKETLLTRPCVRFWSIG